MQTMQQLTPQADLDHLRAFVAVASHLSFAKAAKVLDKDSSVITRRVHALEQHLKTRLFERTTRRMTLTETGRAYLVRVQAALDELELAESEIHARSTHPHGLLRVSLPLTYGRLWIAPLLPGFLEKYPEVQIDARYSDRYVDLIEEGFDVAIRLGALPDSGLVARRIGEWQRRLYASPGYLKRWGKPRTPADLAHHRGLTFSGPECPSAWTYTRGRERIKIAIPSVLTADDATSLVIAAEAGAGLAVATEWLVHEQVARGTLVPVLPDWMVGPPGGIHAVFSSSRLLPGKTRAFIDWVSERLPEKSGGLHRA
jgi:DNA-binding transcriptional LysR family regulator